MQTFLPYPDFRASAAVLDRPRLGKQRVESLQALRALTIPDYGWQSHPAIRMWMGYVPALTQYGLAMADEWVRQGGADSTRAQILEFAPEVQATAGRLSMPPWFGDTELHRSHQSNLIRKDPEFYGRLFPGVPDNLEYVWPEPRTVLLPREPEGDRIWIVRSSIEDPEPENPDRVALLRQRAPGRTSRKWQRQVEAFLTAMKVGDAVAIPLDEGRKFALGAITGDVSEGAAGMLERRIDVTEILDRAAFSYPALLQDPRAVFAVPAP